jgi:hypothetical protein
METDIYQATATPITMNSKSFKGEQQFYVGSSAGELRDAEGEEF